MDKESIYLENNEVTYLMDKGKVSAIVHAAQVECNFDVQYILFFYGTVPYVLTVSSSVCHLSECS